VTPLTLQVGIVRMN